jgi:predicted acetyltransferase
MAIETILAGREDKAIVQRLMELYQYDFSELDGSDVDPHGIYGYDYLDNYWTQPRHYPLIVRAEGQLI